MTIYILQPRASRSRTPCECNTLLYGGSAAATFAPPSGYPVLLPDHKAALIELMFQSGALRFGDFVAKSGRRTPYFLDAGRYETGSQMRQLGRHYADAIHERFGTTYDVLFGPAYKGIPLVVATAMALDERHGRDVALCFNRKEAKDHGEGGVLVGHELRDGDRVLIVEDVTTAGTSIREAVPILRANADIRLAGLCVAVDRMERGSTDKSALEELAERYHMPTLALVTIDEIVAHLKGRTLNGRVALDDETCERIAAYRARFGV